MANIRVRRAAPARVLAALADMLRDEAGLVSAAVPSSQPRRNGPLLLLAAAALCVLVIASLSLLRLLTRMELDM